MSEIVGMDGRPRGRGFEFHPTDEHRRIVSNLASMGISQARIAQVLEIDKKTLIKYFRKELTDGLTDKLAKVANALFMKAIGGDVSACKFILACHGGWSEKYGKKDEAEDMLPYTSRKDLRKQD